MRSPATVQLAADGSNQNIDAGDYFYVTIDSEKAPTEGVYYAETSIALRHPSGTDHVDILSGTVEIQLRYNKGSVIDTVSNASASTYPQDGVSGNYWYTLQGSDNIDAASVGYSNQAPMGGQPITINVTPGSEKVYSGTVRYTYQVQLDNGSWTTIATNSTATSQSYTIPAGTTSFAARVLASDDLGFSSSDYTTGATLSVTNNVPPSAPASISFTEPVAGDTCTLSLIHISEPTRPY